MGADASGLSPARAGRRWGPSRGPPSCSRSPARPTSRSSPGSPGWPWDELDPEARKSFEVALHAGAAGALLIGQRRLIAEELRLFDARRAAVVALSFVPPAIVGYGFERQIERRLGGPRATAIGLVAGAVAMAIADRRPQDRGPGDATPVDGLALGLAQATALAPGVSRNGATLAAARWRRFTRAARQPPLAHRRPAGDRRRDRCSRARGCAAGASTPASAGRWPPAWPPPSPPRSPRRS